MYKRFYLILACFLSLLSIMSLASDDLKEECFKLDELIINGKPLIKDAKTCKYLDNFCTFTSKRKSLGEGNLNFNYTQQIPCKQFEKYRVIRDCYFKYQKVCDPSKRYTLTKECIQSKKK